MRKLLGVIILFFLLIPCAISAEFWASKKSNKYHYPDCKWAQKIHPENLIIFKTPEEAIKAGYIPCKVCRPPTSSKSQSDTKNNTPKSLD
jgi:methylphosphotriester-DNA--protein-cysteine methyltransferase